MKQNVINSMYSSTCLECGDSITHPICIECLKKESIALLFDKLESKRLSYGQFKVLTAQLDNKLRQFWAYPETGVSCVVCGDNMAICSYCASKHLKTIFSREKITPSPFSSFFPSSYNEKNPMIFSVLKSTAFPHNPFKLPT